MDRFGRFTEDARKALVLAQREAQRTNGEDVGSQHLLLGLVENQAGEAAVALRGLGVDATSARQALAKKVAERASDNRPSARAPAEDLRRVFGFAFEAARDEGVEHVGTMHLLVGLLRDTDGIAARALEDLGVNVPQVQALRAGHGTGTAGGGWPQVGNRVLVHDPEPPYRLWEGRVTARTGTQVSVTVEGHPARSTTTLQPWDLHAVPARSTEGCQRCRYPSA